jgi:predicted kinase
MAPEEARATWCYNPLMRLVIINGPSGAGKSKVSERLHIDHPLSFLLDIDVLRRHISAYREHKKESLKLVHDLAVAIADVYLGFGHSVIVDKGLFNDDGTLDKLIEIGNKHRAQVHEFILTADLATVSKRTEERGFKDGGLLNPERVTYLWEMMQQLIPQRKDAVIIETTKMTLDEVYQQVKEVVS